MVKAGLIGIGGMGRGHLANLVRFTNEGEIIKLVAACDIDPARFENGERKFNIDIGGDAIDFSKFACYTDYEEMIEKEELDMVIIALPTYMHKDATLKCLDKGINVLCEKPMGLNPEECEIMMAKAKEVGKRLMIGQVLRFWGEYEVLKEYVDNKTYGEVTGAYFFRGGSLPVWCYEGWLFKRECGGGATHDQHVHDVDMVNYLFGLPKAVSTVGKIILPGSGHDSVSTNYIYDDNKVVNAQDDWTMQDDVFHMNFRVNFEKGTMQLRDDGLYVAGEGEVPHKVEVDTENGYYKEAKYFATLIENPDMVNTVNPPEASMDTIRLVCAEEYSADNHGAVTEI